METKDTNYKIMDDLIITAGNKMASSALCAYPEDYKRYAEMIIPRIIKTPDSLYRIVKLTPDLKVNIMSIMTGCETTQKYARSFKSNGKIKGLPKIYSSITEVKRSYRFELINNTERIDIVMPALEHRLFKQAKPGTHRDDLWKCMIFSFSKRDYTNIVNMLNRVLCYIDAEINTVHRHSVSLDYNINEFKPFFSEKGRLQVFKLYTTHWDYKVSMNHCLIMYK